MASSAQQLDSRVLHLRTERLMERASLTHNRKNTGVLKADGVELYLLPTFKDFRFQFLLIIVGLGSPILSNHGRNFRKPFHTHLWIVLGSILWV